METLSPMDSGGEIPGQSAGSTFGSGESNGGRSPLHMNLGFLKSLTEKKTTTRGMWLYIEQGRPDLQWSRWAATETKRSQTRQ